VSTKVYLVRHARHDLVDSVLCGRSDDGLGPEGLRQARVLADGLGGERIACLQSSPRRRARQTAGPIAERLALPLQEVDAVDELDMGDWTGRSFESLADDATWCDWNIRRSCARPPGGESMPELQRRVVDHIEALRTGPQNGACLIVTHAEPIRAALLHYRGMDLDRFAELVVPPASISLLEFRPDGVGIASARCEDVT
jgi:probable phosphoglycerate mutase